MRNLKKFLALVLAFMMTMSLMVTVNASNVEKAPDAENVTAFEEAIDVLMGMGIIRGGDNGAINPKSNITRAEMAAFIYRLYTGDVAGSKEFLYAETATGFSDVFMDQWYAGPVGFCASNKFITGSNGMFRPTENITGYEALVMVLRAMGYDKEEGEMTGNPEWKQIAHTRALTVGLLNGVNSANYSYSLIQPATREFVAELIFRAAQLPMVTYNRGFINKYEYMNAATGVANQTLGQWQFGLTSNTGVIVGNQATGEGVTKIGFEVAFEGVDNAGGTPDGTYEYMTGGSITNTVTNVAAVSAYHYARTADNAGDTLIKSGANVTLSFHDNKATEFITGLKTAQTDLSLFNHKVKVWYDNRSAANADSTFTGTSNSGVVSFPNNLTTYTIRDEAVLAKVVAFEPGPAVAATDTHTSLNYTAGGSIDNLGEAAAAAGFTVRPSTAYNAYYNYTFSPMNSTNYGTDSTTKSAPSPILKNNSTDSHQLYMVISNNGNKTVDVVISLDLTISQIWEDNKYQLPNSFGIMNGNTTTDVTKPSYNQDQDYFGAGLTSGSGAVSVVPINTTENNITYVNIPRAHVTSDYSKLELRDYVAVVAIAGTNDGSPLTTTFNQTNGKADVIADGTPIHKYDLHDNQTYYQIVKLTKQEVGTVLYIAPDWAVTIQLADGSTKVLPKSIYAEATDGSFAGTSTRGVNDVQVKERYYFYVNENGEYLFYEKDPNQGTQFVYGTYMDWQTGFISGEFQYGLEYVGPTGEKNHTLVTHVDGNALNTSGNYGDASKVVLPKRESKTDYIASATTPGVYRGFLLRTDGKLVTINGTTGDMNTGFYQATATNFGNAVITISDSDVKVGAKEIGDSTDCLALTKDTKFYFVRGTGDSTVNVTPLTFAELQGRTIDVKGTTYIGTGLSKMNLDEGNAVIADSEDLWKMVYYSIDTSNHYAQIVQGGAQPVDTVFIPEACLNVAANATGGQKLIYVGDVSKDLVKKNSYLENEKATMFNVYDAKTGNQESVWIRGYYDSNVDDGVNGWSDSYSVLYTGGDDVFYNLEDTGVKANDGGSIYKLVDLTNSDKTRVVGDYWDETGAVVAQSTNTSTGDYGTVATGNYGRFSPAYFGNETYGYIKDDNNVKHLVNIASAKIVNLNPDRYPVMDTPHDLLYAASVDINEGVNNVSYYLSATGNNSGVVGVVYINANTPTPTP